MLQILITKLRIGLLLTKHTNVRNSILHILLNRSKMCLSTILGDLK